jgi:glutamine cyclotransferase
MRLLRKVVDADLGFDPSRDPDFAVLRHTREFGAILDQVLRQTPPVANSRRITTISELDLSPENLAFESAGRTFLLGSTTQNRIVRCSANGRCAALVTPLSGEHGYVLGLKVDNVSNTVWAATNTQTGASVRQYKIETGQMERTVQLEGKHVFNDLALSSTGVVYVTDTSEGSVYQLRPGDNVLRRMAPDHRFTAANGIALSFDEKLLYVSAWGDGVAAIDLRTRAVEPVRHSDRVCLSFIDGLYWVDGNLVAIQNGPILPRIVQLKLDKRGKRVMAMTILERRNPLFDGITTGVMVGKQLYYIANPQTAKKSSAKLDPLQILAVQVVR